MDEPRFTDVAHAAAWRKERIDVLEAVLAHERKELADCTRDCRRVNVLLAEEEDAADALREALRALLQGEGLTVTAGDTLRCDRCLVESTRRPFPHRPDCPVVRARALLDSDSLAGRPRLPT